MLMVKRILFLVYCLFNRSVEKKAEYLRKHHIFNGIGENCRYAPYWIPADAKYVTLHNNISVSSGVEFICHDTINTLIGHMDDEDGHSFKQLPVTFTPIEVFDNVFLGGNVILCPGVKIGPNAIIAAGAVVSKDVPPGVVVGGVPARIIGSFDETVQKRLKQVEDNN